MILATLCYLKNSGKTLMLHRVKRDGDFHKGKWNGLGGKFEAGETPEECVRREVFEESGLTIDRLHYHGLILFANFNHDDWYVWIFSADQFHGQLLSEPVEGNLEWIADDKVADLNLWPSDHIFLPWLAEGRLFSARFQFDVDKFISHTVSFY
ncbi:MAG TPA: 8-oxo-dGTP diphosphatase [Anaerolineales bacterium]|nr:8-oxo-dGTP diphosphatase [Anaerolineales bacterium]